MASQGLHMKAQGLVAFGTFCFSRPQAEVSKWQDLSRDVPLSLDPQPMEYSPSLDIWDPTPNVCELSVFVTSSGSG